MVISYEFDSLDQLYSEQFVRIGWVFFVVILKKESIITLIYTLSKEKAEMNKQFPDKKLISYEGWMYGPDERLLISKTIGYMLKVIKAGKDNGKYKSEFNAVKHGDYDKFFALMGQPAPEVMVQGTAKNDGFHIKTDGFSQESGDCDVAMIINVNNGLRKFYPDCFNEYGNIQDTHFTDTTFHKCGAFEIALRVHNNNNRSAAGKSYNKQATFNLVDVINELCVYKSISESDKKSLQQGRDFVNMVKHHSKPDYKQKFSSWKEGLTAFNLAW